jgi:hypothetical protein
VVNKLTDLALYYYTRCEKRGLPMEASKALLNAFAGKTDLDIAFSLLKKTKELLHLWVESDTLIQVYKRFFNRILKGDRVAYGDCFAPFVLISCHESFLILIERDPSLRRGLNSFIPELFGRAGDFLEREYFSRKVSDGERLLNGLTGALSQLGSQSLPVATHFAYLLYPFRFPALTFSMIEALGIRDLNEYLEFAEGVRKKELRPMAVFALLHMLLEKTPSKVSFLESLFGIDKKSILMKRAVEHWERGEFWEAHELLEELWCLEKEAQAKDVLQGLVRVAIALHHLSSGHHRKALKVLKLSRSQLTSAKNLPFDLASLRRDVENLIDALGTGSEPETLPTLRMI